MSQNSRHRSTSPVSRSMIFWATSRIFLLLYLLDVSKEGESIRTGLWSPFHPSDDLLAMDSVRKSSSPLQSAGR
ncbi:unnamed protein product [Staurois parvus]|uniref:Uncharacterized protein n=1 Tax=Staurois parvus TaxID=386267 RepID=A0ABN9DZN5_9NEOB|nr:unnamed protein product [Staurois parvus]